MAKLLVQESNGAREFELVDQELSIGRELDNSLRLADPSISRHHAVIRQTEAGHEIQDLGSSNGVLLNGNRVQTALLQDGDRITLGQLQLTFINPAPAATPANPLGTVRISLEEMHKLQGTSQPEPTSTAPVETPAAAAPEPIAPPVPLPTPAPKPHSPWPPQVNVAASNPAPEFLRPYLPAIPDDAEPIAYNGIVERGDFGTRFVAVLIDSLIYAGIVLVFGLAVGAIGFITRGPGCLAFMLYPALGLGYTIFMLWCLVTFRATIGKKIMKLRVVPEDNLAGNPDWGMVIMRYLGHMVSCAACSLPYLLILGAERKGLQDMFSRSIVIKVDR